MKENPIDKDNITETPGTLTYAHNVGSALVKPIDKGRVKGRAVSAMHEQTNTQLAQIQRQIELLAEQARQIKERIDISEKIYMADIGFEPLIGHTYHLYDKADETLVLAMVGPNEWGKKGQPFNNFLATVKLLSDHTWQIIY